MPIVLKPGSEGQSIIVEQGVNGHRITVFSYSVSEGRIDINTLCSYFLAGSTLHYAPTESVRQLYGWQIAIN